jgi:hypothetical protein
MVTNRWRIRCPYYLEKARICVSENNISQALIYYSEAIKLWPYLYDSPFEIAQTARKWDKAIYRQTFEEYADLLMTINRPREAIKHYEIIYDTYSPDTALVGKRFKALRRQGELAAKLARAWRAVARQDKHTRAKARSYTAISERNAAMVAAEDARLQAERDRYLAQQEKAKAEQTRRQRQQILENDAED